MNNSIILRFERKAALKSKGMYGENEFSNTFYNEQGGIKMKFEMIHENYNVSDLDRSITFYSKALGLTEKRRTKGSAT